MCMDEKILSCHDGDDEEVTFKARSFTQLLERLSESGLYWKDLGKEQAEYLLRGAIVGAFLLRDSSHPQYLFTLTFKTLSGVTNIRIVMEDGRYKLEAYDSKKTSIPSFETVLMLISYYVKLSRKISEQIRVQDVERTGQLHLTKPFYKKVCSLQHLCRRTINQSLKSGSIIQLPIPEKTKIYLSHYPYPV